MRSADVAWTDFKLDESDRPKFIRQGCDGQDFSPNCRKS